MFHVKFKKLKPLNYFQFAIFFIAMLFSLVGFVLAWYAALFYLYIASFIVSFVVFILILIFKKIEINKWVKLAIAALCIFNTLLTVYKGFIEEQYYLSFEKPKMASEVIPLLKSFKSKAQRDDTFFNVRSKSGN